MKGEVEARPVIYQGAHRSSCCEAWCYATQPIKSRSSEAFRDEMRHGTVTLPITIPFIVGNDEGHVGEASDITSSHSSADG
ncbi:hypothetical protein PAXRUDRAFT_824768 [Paxillus rubicundulus Ve08.2h10]|uniref:Unplaced genomic scaffold scaffold_106, whole genome shotgun sequence n=1 Tax=Paxillus rubicundulus Ve08.2h10 TaxID=930991 RepID=A0A0D0E1E3_9AGAM|nr:hypothetical protein PAXRUDRAFT_824768 [Paxillus rubicundulus Ve08.2h10]